MTSERRRFIGSNLKMANDRNSTMALLDEAVELATHDDRQFFFFPSMLYVAETIQRVAGSPVFIGSQGCSVHRAGAYTGEVSAQMLRDAGAQVVMVGHYERVVAGESLDVFVEQAARAQEAGLRVLFCLGERDQATDPDDAGDLLSVVGVLQQRLDSAPWILAYEPHWAIGEHGSRPETSYVAARLSALRTGLREVGWEHVPMVYGGSVDSGNAEELDPLADGLFVGRSAWSPAGLREICTLTQAKERT